MPFSLNLPYVVCSPVTRFVRKFNHRRSSEETSDQNAYFDHQYKNTISQYQSHMEDLKINGMTVLDVGSGLGGRALGWLDLGAARVINIDINRQELEAGRKFVDRNYPERAGDVDYRHPEDLNGELGDVAILFDCFEHLMDPASVLKQLHSWLRPSSQVWIGSIGWYHYLASHCTDYHVPIPWCHVFFSEKAIIKTIRRLLREPDYVPNIWERMEGLDRWDNVTTLRDRPGEPLNRLSLRKIRRILRDSPFEVVQFKVVGFKGKGHRLARFASPLAKIPILEEFMHSYYTVLLSKT